jgi:uncharacterized protein (UPF0332 family)
MTPGDADFRIATHWLEKAFEAEESAHLEFEAGHFGFAVNRLYYAVFYGVSAVMAAENREYGRHSAVRAAFNRDFVNTGKVTVEQGRLYNQLFDDRQEADYAPLREFIKDDVSGRLEQVRSFLEHIRHFVKQDLIGPTAISK